MNAVWKVLVGLAVVVPLGAYVAGSLAESASSDTEPRQTIQIRQDPAPTRAAKPATPPPDRPPEADDHGEDDGDDGDDDVEVITPWDDLDDDQHSGGDDDHSGHGRGGDDDSSGNGSGGGDDSGHGGED